MRKQKIEFRVVLAAFLLIFASNALPSTISAHAQNTIVKQPLTQHAAASALSPGSDPPPTLVQSFDAMNGNVGSGNPPDVVVAAGPNHVLEMINAAYFFYTKQGSPVSGPNSLAGLFQTGGDFISDPQALYDPLSGRWFASILDRPGFFVRVAVSQSSDPISTSSVWYRQTLTPACNTTWFTCYDPDQPKIGVSNDKLVVATNYYARWNPICYTVFPITTCLQKYLLDEVWAINKRQMIEGNPNPGINAFGPIPNVNSAHPAQALTSSDDLYLVAAGMNNDGTTTNIVREFKVTGLPPNAAISTTQFTWGSISLPPLAQQPGGTTVWANLPSGQPANDARVQTAVWSNGKLWFALNDGCTAGSLQADCIRLGEIDTSTATIVQSWDFSLPNTYIFYPALTIDSMGNMLLVYGFSSAFDNPGLQMAEHVATEPANSMQCCVLLVQGNVPNNSTRYGDYFGGAIEPTNATNVWVAGEYMNSQAGMCGSNPCWSTRIAEAMTTSFTLSASPSNFNVVRPGSGSSTITLTSVNSYTGAVSFLSQASISITATSVDDSSPGSRSFGLLIDQSLDSQFWTTQPSSVIGCCTTPFNYQQTFSLTSSQHFLEFGVNSSLGQWRAQITVNGVLMATIDTDTSHHVHVIFATGGVAMTSPVSIMASYQPGAPDGYYYWNQQSVGVGTGEVFTPTFTGQITSIIVQFRSDSLITSGHIQPIIYASDGGTYGTNMTGQTPALTVGDSFDITTVPTDFNWHMATLTFSGASQITLNSGTRYAFILNLTDFSANTCVHCLPATFYLGTHTDGTGYPGNPVAYDSRVNTWYTASNADVIFQVASAAGQGAAPTVSISPASIGLPAGGTSAVTLTVSTTASTIPGTYFITIMATSDGLSSSVTVALNVT